MTAPFNLARLFRNLLAALTALACGAAPAFGQNVIRGTVPGWPGNAAYYAPQTVYRYAPAQVTPVVQAQYAPQPTTAYYAPASAARIAYAVPAAGSYQISYAGANQPGVATTAYYGGYAPPVQRVAYMPQQVYYAPQAVAAPVTYYRVYQPAAVAVAPTTCGYAATSQTNSCQSNNGCGWSLWRPFAWLCNSNSCNKPQQTCNYGGCGQPAAVPYYVAPAVPVIPTAPAPVGRSPFGSTIISPSTTTIPAPATRSGPPGGTIINSAPAADRPPVLAPGAFGAPAPGAFGAPAPGTFTPAPAPSFSPPTTPGMLPDGTRDDRFRPLLNDPYSQPAPATQPAPTNNSPLMLAPPASSGTQIGGSPISGNGNYHERTNLIPQNQPNTISEPGFVSPPASVQPLRDPHGDERIQQNNNRAPALITPGDRTAANGQRWGVIPAVWPVKAAEVQPVSKVLEPTTPVVAPMQLDDSGWKSAR